MSYKTTAVSAAAILFLALADLPYGYYIFLRLIVFGTAGFGALKAAEADSEKWTILLGGIALLFNPIIPVHFEQGVWAIIDVCVAVVLLVSAFRLPEKEAV